MNTQAHQDGLHVADNVFIDVWRFEKSGRRRLVEHFSVHNLITVQGKGLAASRLIGIASPAVGWLAIGTGVNVATVVDTILVTEIFRDVLTSSVSTASGIATLTYYLNTSSANGSTLSEIGLFNAVSSGTMYARALLNPTIVKNSSKAVTFTWLSTFA